MEIAVNNMIAFLNYLQNMLNFYQDIRIKNRKD